MFWVFVLFLLVEVCICVEESEEEDGEIERFLFVIGIGSGWFSGCEKGRKVWGEEVMLGLVCIVVGGCCRGIVFLKLSLW